FAERGHFEKAVAHFQIAREMLVKVAGEDNETTMNATLGLAGMLWGPVRLEEGIELGRSVMETRARIHGPTDARKVHAMNKLGQSYWLNGQYLEALELQEMTSIWADSTRPKPPWTNYLSKIHIRLGQLAKAEKMLNWGVEPATLRFGRAHLGVLVGRGHLAHCYARTGRLATAEQLTLDTVRRVEASRGVARPYCVCALWRLARLQVLQGRREEAAQV
ncbi:hypothetical protein N658DRAFT_386317, partial [Parathielavia hyrcaniae]